MMFCARYEGGEFIVVMSGAGAEEGELMRGELKRSIEALFLEGRGGQRLPIVIDIGTAVFPHDGILTQALAGSRRCSEVAKTHVSNSSVVKL